MMDIYIFENLDVTLFFTFTCWENPSKSHVYMLYLRTMQLTRMIEWARDA